MMTDIDYDAIQDRVDSFLNKEKEIDNLKSTITEVEDEFEDLYYQMVEALNENETLKKKLMYHQQIAKNHKIDLDHANENLKYVESAKAGVVQQLEELRERYDTLNTQYGRLGLVHDQFSQDACVEILDLKRRLNESDEQNESLLSIRQQERAKEKEKELMVVIDHQFNELANFKDRVDEQDQIIKEEKRNTQFWYEKATDCGGSLNRYQSEIDGLNKELNEYCDRVKELENQLEANEDNAEYWYETAENLRVENDNLVTRSDINVLEAKQDAYRQGITDAYNGIVNWMKNDIRWDDK